MESLENFRRYLNLKKTVGDEKVMQGFELESLFMEADIPWMMKAASIKSDYGLKDCINLSSSIAFFRLKVE